MALIMKTSPPEVNQEGEKRWYLGDIEDGLKKVFLHESSNIQREQSGCAKHMIRIYTHEGEFVRQTFFNRTHTLNRHICRLFGVDRIELGSPIQIQTDS